MCLQFFFPFIFKIERKKEVKEISVYFKDSTQKENIFLQVYSQFLKMHAISNLTFIQYVYSKILYDHAHQKF